MTIRVLVVEDEPIVAMLLEDYLIELGHCVVGPVSTVRGALEQVAEGQFDLAVLDVNLGGERSDTVAAALDEIGRPYIFATGYGRQGLGEQDTRIVLQKPYQIGQIADALARALGGD
ncbi:response regulator [Hephaestia mangrovi]|uniref:response regulator n=1 Tax=Hephaestia mangrovi TaxID=2873268 RepID=UPI0034E26309